MSGRLVRLVAAGCSIGFGFTLSACGGQDGVALARQACGHVKLSIAAYERARHTTDPTAASHERTAALEQLNFALQLAAQATSANPEWNPLMTTLQESDRVSEQYLIAALRSQCAFAESPNPQPPVITSTVPGQPKAPTPSTLPGQ
jgi:hypothetical protein